MYSDKWTDATPPPLIGFFFVDVYPFGTGITQWWNSIRLT